MTSRIFAISRPRRICLSIAVPSLLACALIAGCTSSNSPNDRQIQQKSAETTADVKKGAQQAGRQIKEGAAAAERTIDDVAAGVKQGLNSSATPAKDAVDINSATQSRLAALPGVSNREAAKIIRNRPYDRTHDLVTKGVMDEDSFSKISSLLVVR